MNFLVDYGVIEPMCKLLEVKDTKVCILFLPPDVLSVHCYTFSLWTNMKLIKFTAYVMCNQR